MTMRSPNFRASIVSGGDNSAASTTPVNSDWETSPKRPNAISFTSLQWIKPGALKQNRGSQVERRARRRVGDQFSFEIL